MLSTHSTLALLSEGCAFILRRYRPHRADVFENRIMLAKAVRTATPPSPLEPGAAHECILEALTTPGAVSGSNEMPVDLSTLAEYLEEPGGPSEDTRWLALGAARDATALLEERNDLAIAALVAHIRSTAVDILRGTGMDYQEALAALEGSVAGSPQEPADAPRRSHPFQEHQ